VTQESGDDDDFQRQSLQEQAEESSEMLSAKDDMLASHPRSQHPDKVVLPPPHAQR
jgi:hypothetical protein